MQFEKKNKKQTKRIIFISVLAVIIIGLIVSAVILSKLLKQKAEEPEEPTELTHIYPEEGRHFSYPIAYPYIDDDSEITMISIENENGSYFMALSPDGTSDIYEFYYDFDEDGTPVSYYPDILKNEDGMLYDNLYSKVTGDGYDRIPMLTYLITAIRAPYFDYRIDLDDDLAKRNAQLAAYGLSPDGEDRDADTETRRFVRFRYTDKDGNIKEYSIEIGSHTVTGSGYYFRIGEKKNTEVDTDGDGVADKTEGVTTYRDYIYVTRETNYFKYALAGVEAYINPVLVSGGLENDQHALYAPYLTPDYRQWKTELHQLSSLTGEDIPEDMTSVTDMFATVNAYIPTYLFEDYEELPDIALEEISLGSYIFNLTELEDNELYPLLSSSLKVALEEAVRNSGDGINQSIGFTQSVLYDRNVIDGAKYRYRILSVNSVLTVAGEITTAGITANEGSQSQYVSVTYELYEYNPETGEYEKDKNVTSVTKGEDGESKYEDVSLPMQGIMNLAELKKLLEAGAVTISRTEEDGTVTALNVDALRAVGYVNAVDIDITYTKKTEGGTDTGLAYKNMVYYLDEVLEVYEVERDSEGKVTNSKRVYSISDDKTYFVAFRYYYVENEVQGKAQNANVGYIYIEPANAEKRCTSCEAVLTSGAKTCSACGASVPEKTDAEIKADKLRAAIKLWLNIESEDAIKVYTENVYSAIISDFIRYEFKNITSFVTGEIVSAFRFVNVSERDPFYGESFYEKTEDFMAYALNQNSCDKVVKLLGGLTETSQAAGLVGKETVKVGITAEALDKYIYRLGIEDGELHGANIIRYSLPRELYVSVETEADEFDDYGWLRTLDFVLYVSEPVWDTETESFIRYVASKMYDIIVKIDADILGFVDLDTVNFWARHDLMLIDVSNIQEFNVDFKMDDLQGGYDFYLNHYQLESGAKWERIDVTKDSGSSFKTKFDEYVEYNASLPVGDKNKETYPSLEGFYEYVAGGEIASEDGDSKGTAMFKKLFLLIFNTKYMGVLTEEEQRAVLYDENGREKPALMTISLKLNDNDPNADTKKTYCYDFFRCDDRRILVRIYEKKTGYPIVPASDFYITSLAFEKIVANIIGVLNGEEIDTNDPYPDYRPVE